VLLRSGMLEPRTPIGTQPASSAANNNPVKILIPNFLGYVRARESKASNVGLYSTSRMSYRAIVDPFYNALPKYMFEHLKSLICQLGTYSAV